MIDGFNTDSVDIAATCREYNLNNADLFLVGIVGLAMVAGNPRACPPTMEEMVERYGKNKQAQVAQVALETPLNPTAEV